MTCPWNFNVQTPESTCASTVWLTEKSPTSVWFPAADWLLVHLILVSGDVRMFPLLPLLCAM